jgi:hypothetical protein
MVGKEDVVVNSYEVVEEIGDNWPSGNMLQSVLAKEGIDFVEMEKDPLYWQVAARWSLLRMYGFPELPTGDHAYKKTSSGRTQLHLGDAEIDSIQNRWSSLSASQDDPKNDLLELLKTSKSNGRQLQWSVMDCAPGCQFNLHAHPNLELAYCAKGALHEIRMKGDPITKTFKKHPNKKCQLKGPTLTDLDRPWYFSTLSAGEWLVNEVGSIHKSFTATSGEGCILLVLWGGSHANILEGEEPSRVNVQDALNKMDDKLGSCECRSGKLSETFLPESEKSKV